MLEVLSQSFLEAIQRGDVEDVEQQLEKNDKLLGSVDAKGWTPIFHAVDKPDDLILAVLLRHRTVSSALEIKDREEGNSAKLSKSLNN